MFAEMGSGGRPTKRYHHTKCTDSRCSLPIMAQETKISLDTDQEQEKHQTQVGDKIERRQSSIRSRKYRSSEFWYPTQNRRLIWISNLSKDDGSSSRLTYSEYDPTENL